MRGATRPGFAPYPALRATLSPLRGARDDRGQGAGGCRRDDHHLRPALPPAPSAARGMTMARPRVDPSVRRCELRNLHLITYENATSLQEKLVEMRQKELIADQLLLLEHPPVITLGRG